MAKIIFGDRVGANGELRLGCSAAIFNSEKKILLTRRTDNAKWCLPSGGMDAGESLKETIIREVKEETGLDIEARSLVGVYSSPNILVEYADGYKFQFVSLCFTGAVIAGELSTSEETSEFGYFTREESRKLDVLDNHKERIEDAFDFDGIPFIK